MFNKLEVIKDIYKELRDNEVAFVRSVDLKGDCRIIH